MLFLQRLGLAARRARLDAHLDLLDVATTAGVSQSTLSEFERGRHWPRHIDRIVSAYEQECGLDQDELWRRALTIEP